MDYWGGGGGGKGYVGPPSKIIGGAWPPLFLRLCDFHSNLLLVRESVTGPYFVNWQQLRPITYVIFSRYFRPSTYKICFEPSLSDTLLFAILTKSFSA